MLRVIFGLVFLFFSFTSLSSSFANKGNILVVLSSEDKISLEGEITHETGFFLSELMVPVKKLLEDNYSVEFANPKGNPAVLDVISDNPKWFSNEEEYLEHRNLCVSLGLCGKGRVGSTSLRKLSDISDADLKNFSGLFVPGGHAPMEDLAYDIEMGRILRHFHNENKPTALICHGPIALLSTLDRPSTVDFNEAEYFVTAMYVKHAHETLPIVSAAINVTEELIREKIVNRFPIVKESRKLETLYQRKEYLESVLSWLTGSREDLDNIIELMTRDWIYKEFKTTIFSTVEEQIEEIGGTDGVLNGYMNYYPEDSLRVAGAFVEVDNPAWTTQVSVHRELITGRNPASDHQVVDIFIRKLEERSKRYFPTKITIDCRSSNLEDKTVRILGTLDLTQLEGRDDFATKINKSEVSVYVNSDLSTMPDFNSNIIIEGSLYPFSEIGVLKGDSFFLFLLQSDDYRYSVLRFNEQDLIVDCKWY